MESSKLQLSAEESTMVQDTHWLLTKNSIIQKVYTLFGEIAAALQKDLQNNPLVPETIRHQSPKISKGENYGGLPYVMLDYPRLFTREEAFAVRTMFWWGNFISVTWQLKGSHAEHHRTNILHNYARLASAGFQLCISADEWRHDFEPDNYQVIQMIDPIQLERILIQRPFIKLAVKIPLNEWNTAKVKVTEIYYLILAVAAINFQGGETDLSPGSPRAGFDL